MIGRHVRRVEGADTLDTVTGTRITNDVTVRDYQYLTWRQSLAGGRYGEYDAARRFPWSRRTRSASPMHWTSR